MHRLTALRSPRCARPSRRRCRQARNYHNPHTVNRVSKWTGLSAMGAGGALTRLLAPLPFHKRVVQFKASQCKEVPRFVHSDTFRCRFSASRWKRSWTVTTVGDVRKWDQCFWRTRVCTKSATQPHHHWPSTPLHL